MREVCDLDIKKTQKNHGKSEIPARLPDILLTIVVAA